MTWEVAGFVAEELIGFGASGEVWRARDVNTGEVVALKRLRAGQQPAEHQRLCREAAVLSEFIHPHVVSLRSVLTTADGLMLVLDHAAGGSLGGLIARRGRCTAGEVAGVLVRIAGALAAAHAVGLTHGDVSPGNVLLDAEGQPLLADLGTARLLSDAGRRPTGGTPGYVDPAVSAGHVPGPASDVYALAAVAVHALTGRPPGPDPAAALQPIPVPATLRRLLRRSLDRDPAGRPSAAALAADLHALGVEEPLRVTPGGDRGVVPGVLTHAAPQVEPPPTPDATGRFRWAVAGRLARLASPAVLRSVAAAVVLLIGAVAAGLFWGSGATGAQPADAGAVPGPSWTRVWTDLDSRRAQAFATADATLLDQVYLPGCPALATDLRAVRDLAGRRARATGVAHQVRSVQVESASPRTVTLLVVDRMSAYQVRGPAGELLAQAPPRGDRRLRARMVHTDAGWRIASLAGG